MSWKTVLFPSGLFLLACAFESVVAGCVLVQESRYGAERDRTEMRGSPGDRIDDRDSDEQAFGKDDEGYIGED